MTLSIYIIM